MYSTQRLTTVQGQWAGLLKAHCFGGTVIAVVMVVGKLEWVDRSAVLLFLSVSLVALTIERVAVLDAMHVARRGGRNARNALIIGSGRRAVAFARTVATHDEWGLRIIGFLQSDDEDPSELVLEEAPILGHVDDIREVLGRSVVDEVIFCVHPRHLNRIQDACEEAEQRGLIVRLVADFMDWKITKADVGHADGLPILTFRNQPQRVVLLTVKRMVDLTMAVILLGFLSPLMILISVLIKLSSPAP